MQIVIKRVRQRGGGGKGRGGGRGLEVASTRIAERCATAAPDTSFVRNVSAPTIANYYSTGTRVLVQCLCTRAFGKVYTYVDVYIYV